MIDVPVLIAGAGPVGMTLALDLAQRGIRTMIVERNPTTTRHPKMDITNGRSMELFRNLGIANELRAAAVPAANPFDVTWITDFTGVELHRFVYPSVDEWRRVIRERNDGTQPLEPSMRVSQVVIEPELRKLIERHALVELRYNTAFDALRQDADGVSAVLRDVTTGETLEVRCAYLAGCDGGGSLVREGLGIKLDGQARIMERYMTHFRTDDRSLIERWGVAWHFQSVNGTLIAQNDRDVWTLHTRYQDGTLPNEIDARAMLRRFFGYDIEAEILVANVWTPHLLVADSYSKGRVFLAGDAAHQYIPTGGYGMNTGIGDATNLGWKLAAVLHGYADPGLLDSYDIERRPVGVRNRDAAGANNDVRRQIGALYDDRLYQSGPEGDARRAEVGQEIARLGNLENEAWGIEYGYVYADSPAVAAEPGATFSQDPAVYEPNTVPGARLPSVFLRDGTALFDHLGRWFTLLNFGDPDASEGLEAAAAARGVPLKVLHVEDPAIAPIYQAPLVLVRTDQHVAWRGERCDEATALRVIDRITGRAN
ncbi:FAD-dependent monooxygenase [Ruixingdingia sedimenti]|uniref:FAD-dependent monooxygenase n=1 Tax=Ruixingdingia sedimenti TaxID=3073604 RepID=A0ABU1FD37_9RHOB|nr:FAD-dependent monooxygenase [Xinfangfangia sp. LG-4]MDR5654799.1 FAD-dependent monooxygenase [Xinfangfangia sp. LG-4]